MPALEPVPAPGAEARAGAGLSTECVGTAEARAGTEAPPPVRPVVPAGFADSHVVARASCRAAGSADSRRRPRVAADSTPPPARPPAVAWKRS